MGMTKEAQDLVNRGFSLAERLVAAIETSVKTKAQAEFRLSVEQHLVPGDQPGPMFESKS